MSKAAQQVKEVKKELRTLTIQELFAIYEQWSKLEVKSFEGLMAMVSHAQVTLDRK